MSFNLPQRWADLRHLLIDADDTLWENNIYFERATEEFIDFLNHSTLGRDDVRAVLDEFERVNARDYGYGSKVYARSLEACYRRLSEREIDEEKLQLVLRLGRRILEQEIKLIPHVETTLAHLNRRYLLTLCTKGDPEEQQLKVDRSGLAHYFHQVEIMAEKDLPAYERTLDRLGAAPGEACMIGNSPRSDINPPLALGMWAVFIPHDHTWRLEHQEIDHNHERLLMVERFADLLHHF